MAIISESEVGAQSRAESRAESIVDRVDQSARVLVAISVHALSPWELTAALGLGSKSGALKRVLRELLEGELIAMNSRAANKSIAEVSHYSARIPATGRAHAIKIDFVFAVSSRRYVGSNFARLAKSAADGSLSRGIVSEKLSRP